MEKKRTILLVEDEQMLADMYKAKFTMEHFETLHAADGLAGIAMARAHKPDIILLDIIMPKMDGFLALQELKKDPALKDTPVILLTNLGQDDDIAKGKKLGATDYFVKANHSPAEIVEKIRKYLR